MSELQKEIDRNYDYFITILPDLMKSYRNKYALIKEKKVVAIYDTMLDARTTGDKFIKDGIFSIQKIDDHVVDLGYYSHVADTTGA